MKKTFKTLALMLLTALAFSSCADVPEPYNLPGSESDSGNTPAATIEPAGEGTLASPYNVAAIVAKIKEMEAGVESTEEYYIKGKVTNVKTDEATIKQYGNHTFEMIDEGNSSVVFTAFQVYGPGKKKFTAVDDIKVGDEVVVCGKVVNFRGNTPETVGKGAAYVVSINSSSEGGDEQAKAVTCAEAVELTKALEDGATSSETYSITGYITEVIGTVSRNQQTFWMADTKDGGQVFEAYWANLPEGVTEFKVGMKVKITGQLMKYVKGDAITPEIKNADVVILEDVDSGQGGDTPVEGTEVTCAQAVELVQALADGGTSTEVYTVTGYITQVIGEVSTKTGSPQQSFWMADTKDGGQVFQAYWANLPEGVAAFTAGSKVKITGKLKKYVKSGAVTPEIQNATVVILEDADSGQGGDTPVEGTEVTCAQAVALVNALADGGTSTEVYTVTGYITQVIGEVSTKTGPPQQSFWMADTKDGGQVFQAYWANLPEGVAAFTAGSKVKITGKLKKYVKSGAVTPEIQNATVVILEAGDGGDTPEPPTPGPGGDEVTELVNGGFESWVSDSEPTGWKSQSSASSATLSQSTDARTGRYSCFVKGDAKTNKRLATQEITLAPGTYTFSFYAKAATADAAQAKAGYVPISIEDNVYKPGNFKYESTFTNLSGSDWTLVSTEFTLQEETMVCLLVMNPKSTTSTNVQYTAQDILVDDVTLVKK